MFDASTVRAVTDIAARIHVEPAALLAVAEVESAGQATALVRGRPMPLIRWEGHYFDQRLKNGEREIARQLKLASPTAGKIANPASQAARYAMVDKAKAINKQAALESFSIGVGQVMTAHWKKLGFSSVEAMIELAETGIDGQVDVMARYIQKFALDDELQRHDWPAFARGYNGKNFRKYKYDTKIAKAYLRYGGAATLVSEVTGMLRMGSKGAKVRELQTLLVRAGYAVRVDGDYGPSTRDAVKLFQKAEKLRVDGVAGPATFRLLTEFKVDPDETPGKVKIADVSQVKKATSGGGVLLLVTQFRDEISGTASSLMGVEADTAQMVANALLAGSGLVGAGLACWAIWGVLHSRKTNEGDLDADAVTA